jgi:tRNA threonylcarbamoyladenosine biosynthesis protein TsaB
LSVAITENRVVLREVILPPDRKHLENLAPLIRDLTAELHVSVLGIDGFGVALGPGSFSGTRVGLATIKGMALALAKPVAGISSLDILAWQALKDGEWGAPVIDARRGEIYTAFYRKSGEEVMLVAGPMLIKAEEFSQHTRKSPVSLSFVETMCWTTWWSQFLTWSEAPWQLRLLLLALY